MASSLSRFPKLIIDAIVFSNIWISLGALSSYASVRLIIQESFLINEGALIFCATFLGYNYLKLKGLDFNANQSAFNVWMREHRYKIYAMMFGAGLTFLYALSSINFFQLLVLGLSALLSLIYAGVERFNLRSFWFLKTQLVAFVWAVFIVGVSFGTYDYHPTILAETYLFMALVFAAVFFFILGLTIPFDIRDWEVDLQDGKMKTLPMVFGLNGTKYLAYGHLILSFILFYFIDSFTSILLLLFLIAAIIITRLKSNSHEYHYTLVLDGLIVLVYPLLVLVK